MQTPAPIATDIVLLGAGAAHLHVLRRFARRPRPGIRLTLVAPAQQIPAAFMLPGLVSGERTTADACIDLAPLAAASQARLILAEPTGLDLAGRWLDLAAHPPLPFDLLSLDLPAEAAIPAAPGAGIQPRPPAGFLVRLDALGAALPDGARLAIIAGALERRHPEQHPSLRGAPRRSNPLPDEPPATRQAGDRSVAPRPATACPADPAHSENAPNRRHPRAAQADDTAAIALALALARRWRGRLRLVLLCAGPEPLAAAPPRARRAARAALVDAGVELVSAVRAGALTAGRMPLFDGTFLAADAALWAGGTRPRSFISCSGLACDAAGRVLVNAGQRSVSHYGIFAAGDCAARPSDPAAGPLLAANLCRAVRGQSLRRSFRRHLPRPVIATLDLGGGRAIAWTNRLAVSGSLVWRCMDWLTRRRLRAYQPDTTQAAAVPPHRAAPPGFLRRMWSLRWLGPRHPSPLSESLVTPHQAEQSGELGL